MDLVNHISPDPYTRLCDLEEFCTNADAVLTKQTEKIANQEWLLTQSMSHIKMLTDALNRLYEQHLALEQNLNNMKEQYEKNSRTTKRPRKTSKVSDQHRSTTGQEGQV